MRLHFMSPLNNFAVAVVATKDMFFVATKIILVTAPANDSERDQRSGDNSSTAPAQPMQQPDREAAANGLNSPGGGR